MNLRYLVLTSLMLLSIWSLPTTAATSPCTDMASASGMTSSGRVNLNTANEATLQRELSGIGSAKASAIVEHRDAYGAFESVDELLEVQGIGKSLLDRNRHRLVID